MNKTPVVGNIQDIAVWIWIRLEIRQVDGVVLEREWLSIAGDQ